jgi:hypothetical protein
MPDDILVLIEVEISRTSMVETVARGLHPEHLGWSFHEVSDVEVQGVEAAALCLAEELVAYFFERWGMGAAYHVALPEPVRDCVDDDGLFHIWFNGLAVAHAWCHFWPLVGWVVGHLRLTCSTSTFTGLVVDVDGDVCIDVWSW